MLAREVEDQPLDPLPLQAEVAACRATASDDRKPDFLAVEAGLIFANADERTDDHMFTVVRDQPRGHRFERTGEEQVEEQRLDEVVEMMAERYFRSAYLRGDAVQHAAP